MKKKIIKLMKSFVIDGKKKKKNACEQKGRGRRWAPGACSIRRQGREMAAGEGRCPLESIGCCSSHISCLPSFRSLQGTHKRKGGPGLEE